MSEPDDAPYVPDADPVILSLLPGYLENRRQDPGKIRAALAAQDFTQLRQLGHNLKGSGGAYGLPPISEFGAEIEQAALAKEAGRIQAAVDALEAFLTRVRLTP